MDINIIVLLLLCVIVLILLIVIFSKDKQYDKKSDRLEQALTDLIKENFAIKKELTSIKEHSYQANIENIEKIIDEKVEEKIVLILETFQNIDNLIKEKNLPDNNQE